MGTIRWYNGRRKLGQVIADRWDRTGRDLFIPAQGAVNGSMVPPGPGGLFHGTRVSFVPVSLDVGRDLVPRNKGQELVCADVRPLPGQVGLSVGVHTDIGAKERNDDRLAAMDLHELGFIAGVFDGHRGPSCADYIARHLPAQVLNSYRAKVKRSGPGGIPALSTIQEAQMISSAIEHAFVEVDKAWLTKARTNKWHDGSTALVALICHGFEAVDKKGGSPGAEPAGTVKTAPGGIAKLFVGWCGDSRAVLLRGRQGLRCTVDHRPERTEESRRIEAAGGRVVQDAYGIWRVGKKDEGRFARELQKKNQKKSDDQRWFLSTSRSFGDIELKEPNPIVVADPEVRSIDLAPDDWGLVLGSDGIFDFMSDQEIADVLWQSMGARGDDPVKAAQKLVSAASQRGSKDNLTVVVMRLGWTAPPADGAAPAGQANTEDNIFG